MATNDRILSIERATGRDWDGLLTFLERIGAAEMSHREIAAAPTQELEGTVDNPGWWAQGATIAYEQLIGRRIPGQASDGTFRAGVRRSAPLGMRALMDAWSSFAARDDAVAALVHGEARPGGTEKRLSWRTKAPDGATVAVTSEPTKSGGASIGVEVTGLVSPEATDEARHEWTAVLERFVANHGTEPG